MKRLAQILSALVIVTVGGAFLVWMRFTSFLQAPSNKGATEKIIVVPSNATPAMIVDLFGKEELVGNVSWLSMYFEHFAREMAFPPGEYALSASMSPIELLRRISSGKVVTYQVTIAPGARSKQIVELLVSKGLGDKAELERLVFDDKTASDLRLSAPSLEGYLFPDVYELPRGLAPQALLAQLVGRYRKIVAENVLDIARARGLTENELITLASLIEKSDALPNERKVYSAMLHNRLAAGMPLEVRESVDYGIEKLGLTVEGDPLDVDHDWNTFIRPGLPPTAIASPGLAAIVAAAEPAVSGALYWVKRGDGAHAFCMDFECYSAELKKWDPDAQPRRPRREKRKR